MRPKVQVEALAQHRVIDLADRSLPRGAGIGDDDVEPAIRLDDARHRTFDGLRLGHVAGKGERSVRFGGRVRLAEIDVEHRHLGAFRAERRYDLGADPRPAARDQRDLPGERLSLALCPASPARATNTRCRRYRPRE